jgi:hypothetical protein
VYGASRIFAWFAWARWVDHAHLDLSWGGPDWVVKAPVHHGWSTTFLLNTLRGGTLFVLALWLVWRLLGRRLWARASPAAEPLRAKA